jgi:hypothetical protein
MRRGAGPDRRGTARAVRHGPHRGGVGVSDAWAPTDSGSERERRGADTWASPEKKEVWAESEGT